MGQSILGAVITGWLILGWVAGPGFYGKFFRGLLCRTVFVAVAAAATACCRCAVLLGWVSSNRVCGLFPGLRFAGFKKLDAGWLDLEGTRQHALAWIFSWFRLVEPSRRKSRDSCSLFDPVNVQRCHILQLSLLVLLFSIVEATVVRRVYVNTHSARQSFLHHLELP